MESDCREAVDMHSSCQATSKTRMETFDEVPVIVRNASKSYWQRNTEDRVLVDLNMTVPKGSIYGLLGPSGCGKTTLLRCIIGRLSLDKGVVCTLGQTPGSPGSDIPGPRLAYMPQEDALDGVLTIMELLCYYGYILGVGRKRVQEKTNFLLKFLKLPQKNTLFSTLSGGQKRRVSFAVALIHDAELLLLDEPTVGVDPILKQNIWNYLYELVQDGKKTVMMTTHYIEEARGANFVGMMYDGRLLAEDSPEQLIAHYHRKTLEEVFLCVCVGKKNHEGKCGNQDATEEEDPELGNTVIPLLRIEKSTKNLPADAPVSEFHTLQCETHDNLLVQKTSVLSAFLDICPNVHWTRLKAIVYRGFVQLLRYPGLLLLIMVSPSFQIALCGFALGRHVTSINLAVVNNDVGHLASQFLSLVDKNVIVQNNFTSWESASQAVRDAHMWGVLRFHHNFSDSLLYRFNNTPYVDLHILQSSNIDVSLDGTNFLFAETIRFVLMDAYEKFISKVLDENNVNPSFAKIPLVSDEPVFGKRDDPYSIFIMPSFITASSFFAQMGMSVIALYLDKEGGKLERIYSTGVTPFEVIFGFLVLQTIVLIAGVILMLVTALVIFRFANHGSLMLIVILCILQGMCGTLFGMLVSACVATFLTTSIITMTVLVLSTALGGYFWPLEASSAVVRYICWSTPFPLAADAMRHIMYRQFNLLHPSVLRGFGISVFWIIVFMFSSIVAFRIRRAAG